jgi:hypothetical protein
MIIIISLIYYFESSNNKFNGLRILHSVHYMFKWWGSCMQQYHPASIQTINEQTEILYSQIKKLNISYTFEFNIQATEFKFHSLQSLTEGLMIVANALLCPSTKRQGKVSICFLSIMVRSNSVHPQDNFIMIIILKQRNSLETLRNLKEYYLLGYNTCSPLKVFMFLWNIGWLSMGCRALYPRWYYSPYRLLLEPQILLTNVHTLVKNKKAITRS